MTRTGRLLLRIARWFAGAERAEWTDAMQAEAQAAGAGSTGWALGCVLASARDRLARDWWVFPAIVLLPIVAFVWKSLVFFSTASLLEHQEIPALMAVACWILAPFPLALLFMRWRNGKSAYVVLAISFLAIESFPLLMFWEMGVPPSAWFGPNVHSYKADPDIAMSVPAGMALDFLVWLAAAWLGTTWRHRAVD